MTKTIVMIHGMWGSSWVWDKMKSYFEERGFHCHTPVLRYHDVDPQVQPDPRLGTTSLLDYVKDLEQYIAELDEKPIIIGHSMGGLLAQILASRKLGSALILLTPSSPAGIFAITWSVFKCFSSVLLRWGFWRKPHRISFKKSVYAMMELLPEKEQQSSYARFGYESGRAAAEIGFWFFDSLGASKVESSAITCPILTISGSRDRITPASVVKKVARKYKSAYKNFPGHTHWVIGEPGWEDIAGFVYNWIQNADL